MDKESLLTAIRIVKKYDAFSLQMALNDALIWEIAVAIERGRENGYAAGQLIGTITAYGDMEVAKYKQRIKLGTSVIDRDDGPGTKIIG